MNDTLSKVALFVAGAGIGSVVTWRLVKEYYSNIANEEIADVKSWYARKYGEESVSKKFAKAGEAVHKGFTDGIRDVGEKPKTTEKDLRKLTEELQNMGYTNYASGTGVVSEPAQQIEEKKVEDVERPYVIDPKYFDEYDDYTAINLTLYEDGVLVDDSTNEPVEDVDETVGLDNLKHIGEYEEDAVHVRNDKLRCDYEILCDTKKYSDISPHLAEDE